MGPLTYLHSGSLEIRGVWILAYCIGDFFQNDKKLDMHSMCIFAFRLALKHEKLRLPGGSNKENNNGTLLSTTMSASSVLVPKTPNNNQTTNSKSSLLSRSVPINTAFE